MIAGPTASGKSQLGIEIARKCNGVVINVDSMQVYDVLHLLTAQPNKDDMAGIPHYLYGFAKPGEIFSAGKWLKAVQKLLQSQKLKGKTCIFVGGTGLYLHALLGRLANIPSIKTEIREKWRQFLKEKGIKPLYEYLVEKDPAMAQRLSPTDGQRILRALEVWEGTGRSLIEWQCINDKPSVDIIRAHKHVLMPQKENLAVRINTRFDMMIEKGVVEEVRKLRAMNLDPEIPVMKAIGVKEFSTYLDGKISLKTAIEKAKTRTRRYAKQQRTWFRHQFDKTWQCFPDAEKSLQAFLRDMKCDSKTFYIDEQ
ncbi:MAG: tRNA dimethylallyltransferase [Candidatus Tokpelaia sp. JSC188]|nr:MAG: tRNA dimethylallyltransferase [Candidatus Tokpelaia sp. JSC188]